MNKQKERIEYLLDLKETELMRIEDYEIDLFSLTHDSDSEDEDDSMDAFSIQEDINISKDKIKSYDEELIDLGHTEGIEIEFTLDDRIKEFLEVKESKLNSIKKYKEILDELYEEINESNHFSLSSQIESTEWNIGILQEDLEDIEERLQKLNLEKGDN